MANYMEASDPFLTFVNPPNNLDNVAPLSQVFPAPGVHVEPSSPAMELAWLRGNFPYLAIEPAPDWSHSWNQPVSGVVSNFDIPDGTTFIRLSCFSSTLAGMYYSFSNSALNAVNATAGDSIKNGVAMLPGIGNEGAAIYVKGRHQISFVGLGANVIVGVRGWIVRDEGR